MDIRVVIIGITILIVIFMMGNDPMEEIRKREKENSLESQIQRYFAKEKEGGVMGFGVMGGSNVLAGSGSQPNYQSNYQPNQPSRMVQPTLPQPAASQPSRVGALPQAVGALQQNPDWYALEQVYSLSPGTLETVQNHPKPPEYYLKDGRRIFFSGFKVYLLTPGGELKLLTDGSYEMQNGETLQLKNGRRQIDSQIN